MRIIFVTDFHGDKHKYDTLIEVAKRTRADLVINGGDMLPNKCDLFKQGDFITDYIADHFLAFEKAKIHYLCFLGNDDLRIFDDIFSRTCSRFSHVIDLAQRRVTIGQYEFIGMNYVVDYPFRLKDRCRKDAADYVLQYQQGSALLSAPDGWQEITDWPGYINTLPTLEEELGRLPELHDASKTVYVIHMPPAKLNLDKCASGDYVGSQAVYNFILKTQPRLTLHGHIHESPEVSGIWLANILNTTCIQPGQTLHGLIYVLGDLDTMQFKRVVANH